MSYIIHRYTVYCTVIFYTVVFLSRCKPIFNDMQAGHSLASVLYSSTRYHHLPLVSAFPGTCNSEKQQVINRLVSFELYMSMVLCNSPGSPCGRTGHPESHPVHAQTLVRESVVIAFHTRKVLVCMPCKTEWM